MDGRFGTEKGKYEIPWLSFGKAESPRGLMDWLNFHHVLYFRAVAREGGVANAARRLRVTPPTVSEQVRLLEQQLGEKLFSRTGRGLVLTEAGQRVLRHADEIHDLGEELKASVRSPDGPGAGRLTVGLSMVVPKLVAHRLLQPALEADPPPEIVCVEDKTENLLAGLATYSLDLVLSDAPRGAEVAVRAFNHFLGECGVSFFAAAELAARYRPGFPGSLDDAPMLLPSAGAALRISLDHWFQDLGIRPRAAGVFDDSALMKVFGASGSGVFPAPTAIEREVMRQYGVQLIGRADNVLERFYAISVERRLRHPAVVAISEEARTRLFTDGP